MCECTENLIVHKLDRAFANQLFFIANTRYILYNIHIPRTIPNPIHRNNWSNFYIGKPNLCASIFGLTFPFLWMKIDSPIVCVLCAITLFTKPFTISVFICFGRFSFLFLRHGKRKVVFSSQVEFVFIIKMGSFVAEIS